MRSTRSLERHALRRELGGALAALGARFGRVDDALRGHGACVAGGWGGCPTCLSFGLPQRQKLPIFVRGLLARSRAE